MIELLKSANRCIDSAKSALGTRGDWNQNTLLGYLVDVDTEVWIPRIKTILASQPDPKFGWWEPESDATIARYAGLDIASVSVKLLEIRSEMLMLLKSVTDWDRDWIHETRGRLTLKDLLSWVLEHNEEHRASYWY